MGRIPEYRRDAVRRTPIDRSGFAEADAMRATAQGFQVIGEALHQKNEMQMRKEAIRDESFLNKKSIELQNRSDEIFQQWQKNNNDDPMGKTESLRLELDELKKEFQEASPSKFASEKMGEVSDKYFLSVGRRAQRWEDEQLVKNTARDAGEGLEQLQLRAYRNPTPQNLALLHQEAEQVIAPLKDTIRPELVEESRKRFQHGSTMSMFEGLVERNQLSTAQKLLNSKEYDEHLGVDGLQRIQTGIKRKKEFNKAKARNLDNLKLKNPWGYLQKVGEKIPQLDLQNMSPDSFLKRSSFIDEMNKKHGLKLKYLAPQEENFFVNELPKQQPTKQVQFVATLNDIPQKEYYQVANQVYEKNPAYGAMFGLMRDGGHQAAEDSRLISSGMNLVSKNKETGKKGINSPSNNQVSESFDAYITNSIRDPRVRESVRDAAFYHYSQRMFNKGELPEDLNEEEYKKSVNALVGEPVQINDSSVLPFRNDEGKFLDPDEMEDLIEGLTDEKVEKAQGDVPRTVNGEPINLKKARGRLNFQSISEGKYWVFLDDKITTDKNDNFFVLDLKKVDKLPKDKGIFQRALEAVGFD